jgi:hypothetical protein
MNSDANLQGVQNLDPESAPNESTNDNDARDGAEPDYVSPDFNKILQKELLQSKEDLQNKLKLLEEENKAKIIVNTAPLTQQTAIDNVLNDKLTKLQSNLNTINTSVPTLSNNIITLIEKYNNLKKNHKLINNELETIKIKFNNIYNKLVDVLPQDKREIYRNINNINITDETINTISDEISENQNNYSKKIEDNAKKNIELILGINELKELNKTYKNTQDKLQSTISEMIGTSDNIISEINSNIETLKTTSPEQTTTQSGGKRQKRNKKVTKRAKVKNNSKKRNKKTRSKKNKRTRKHRN